MFSEIYLTLMKLRSSEFMYEMIFLASSKQVNLFTPFMQPKLHKLVIENLPPDSTSQQNAAIIAYPHSRTWPLVLDSLGIAEQWLRGREKEAKTIQYQVLDR